MIKHSSVCVTACTVLIRSCMELSSLAASTGASPKKAPSDRYPSRSEPAHTAHTTSHTRMGRPIPRAYHRVRTRVVGVIWPVWRRW